KPVIWLSVNSTFHSVFIPHCAEEFGMANTRHINLTRRTMVSVLGAGLAANAPGSTLAQNLSSSSLEAKDPMIEDPRSKYPKPPFKTQTQPWPGLARDMDPKPDHGETTYRGSGDHRRRFRNGPSGRHRLRTRRR